MKEKLYFIKWCWHKLVASIKSWDHWMWAWMMTCFTGSAWANSTAGTLWADICHWAMIVLIVGYWIGYALLYTGVKKAWKSYQEEKQKVINILGERNEFSTNGR